MLQSIFRKLIGAHRPFLLKQEWQRDRGYCEPAIDFEFRSGSFNALALLTFSDFCIQTDSLMTLHKEAKVSFRAIHSQEGTGN